MPERLKRIALLGAAALAAATPEASARTTHEGAAEPPRITGERTRTKAELVETEQARADAFLNSFYQAEGPQRAIFVLVAQRVPQPVLELFKRAVRDAVLERVQGGQSWHDFMTSTEFSSVVIVRVVLADDGSQRYMPALYTLASVLSTAAQQAGGGGVTEGEGSH